MDPLEIGKGLISRNRLKNSSFQRDHKDKASLKSSHCGGSGHIEEGCFKLIGYPKWWEEHRQRKAATKAPIIQTSGKANLTTNTEMVDTLSPSETQNGGNKAMAANTHGKESNGSKERKKGGNGRRKMRK